MTGVTPTVGVELSPENEYLRTFHWIVTSGIVCGLDHPIEWAVNALRTPGATLEEDYYERMYHHLPRFLVEMFEAEHCRESESIEELRSWCDNHYPEGHLCRGFFSDMELWKRK